MKLPPQITITQAGPSKDGKNFIKTRRGNYHITFPHGEVHEMEIDVIDRVSLDASIIIPYVIEDDGSKSIWLRSCVRPAAAIRYSSEMQDSSEFYVKFNGNFWELAAGLIDSGEGPIDAAKRECMEEVGFDIDRDSFLLLHVSMPVPSILAEHLYYFAVDVTDEPRHEPSLDGSILEMHGECILVPLQELIEECRSGKIVDMKTHLGLLMLNQLR